MAQIHINAVIETQDYNFPENWAEEVMADIAFKLSVAFDNKPHNLGSRGSSRPWTSFCSIKVIEPKVASEAVVKYPAPKTP